MSTKKIIFTHGGGRFGNQLINYIHLAACGLEYKNVKINQQSLKRYLRPIEGKHIVSNGELNSLSVVKDDGKKPNRYYKYILRLVCDMKTRWTHFSTFFYNERESIVIGERGNHIGYLLGDHVENLIFDDSFIEKSKHIIFLSGWGFRNWFLTEKWRNVISQNLSRTLNHSDLALKNDVLGVHIRGTDFKEHANGDLYLDVNDWVNAIKIIEKKFEVKKVILMSDERKEWSHIVNNNNNWMVSDGSVGNNGDMYDAFSDLLSCDFILTAGSTFALMAAWISDAKVFDVSETNVNCKAMKYEEWSSYHRFLLNWK